MALTNGSQDAAEAQIANSGLDTYFERVLSVESVGKFKPAPETYLWAATQLEVEIDEMLMVAALTGTSLVPARWVAREPISPDRGPCGAYQ